MMTTLIEKIIDDALDRSDITDPIGEMLEYVADRILEEILNILKNEQGSMNVRADHARHLAEEIKWKLTTDFQHFTTEFKHIPDED